MKTRVIPVDDHALILTNMYYLLSAYDDLRIITQARDADGLLVQLEAHPYDLLIIDLMMPGSRQIDGLRLVQKVRRRCPGLPIIVVTIPGNPTLVLSLLKLDIHSLMNKRGMLNDPPKAVRRTGRRPLISSSTVHLLEVGEAEHGKPLASLEQLTPCEVEMLRLYGSGLAVGEIVTRLCRSRWTINVQKGSAMRKLDLGSNAGLFIYIRENGLAQVARLRYIRSVSPLRKAHAATRTSHGAGRHPCPLPPRDFFHMNYNRRLSARLCLLPLGPASQAEAREPQPRASRLLDTVARQVGHDGWIVLSYESPGPFPAVAYRPWPDDLVQMAITMAYLDSGDTAVEGERHPHPLSVRADSRNDRLLERYSNDLEENAPVAVDSNGLWLDTVRYHLSLTVYTFGVVFHSIARGTSCPETDFDNLLTLVVPAGDGKLRPALNIYLDQRRALKGSVYPAEPGFEQEVSYPTLGLGRGRSNGFAGLVVTPRVNDGETENGKPLRTVRRTLRYDGERYPFEEYSDSRHCQ